MSPWRIAVVCLIALALVATAVLTWYLDTYDAREPSRLAYAEHCAGCHGPSLEGSDGGPALVGPALRYGDSTPELIASIRRHARLRVAADDSDETLSAATIKALALYVSEQRQGIPTIPESFGRRLPQGTIHSQHHNFRVEHIAEFSSYPYSMAPLPSGEILVVEKTRGLSLVGLDGQVSSLIEGTPPVWKEMLKVRGSYVGLGMMLDVRLHPDYEDNGWVYLSHADRCQLDCGSLVPQTMVRVVRGRIRDGAWHDNKVIWSVDTDFYTIVPDNVAGGRLAFDHAGHLFVTIGGKATYDHLHVLDTPYGKIHRVKDDGAIPEDNPFWQSPDARSQPSTRHTVWSFGHRTAQGLAAHPETGAIWATEMGPRGGDEVNRIVAGGNYGWPLYTEGLDYSGEPVSIGEGLGLDFARSDTIAPVADFTPSPSLSSFTFHNGDQFPDWNHDLLVGSLRARTLFRLRIDSEEVLEQEKLVEDLGRIRDVQMGYEGYVYVLIEHQDGGSLLRLVPSRQ